MITCPIETACRIVTRSRLSNSAFSVLLLLHKHKSYGMTEIAIDVGISKAAMTGIIDSLTKSRLVQRDRHDGTLGFDRRSVLVRLTLDCRAYVDTMLADLGRCSTMSDAIKVGDVFGRLKITRVYSKEVTYGGYSKRYGCVDADCSCGTVCKGIWSRGLLRGSTKSCTCLRAEMVRANNKRRSARHGDFRLGLEELTS